ncbi:putative polysaccharide biosynthesis protein [Bacillus xiapuensis]|uniref:putative polysaccharide biosynthesis protein n=1 Tax=Bacillus xiapuensis TaxID=2014075 RepID=UPI001E5FEC1B|nr:polysaccharide biosynthesis protein [Bacillus xiapuensis]
MPKADQASFMRGAVILTMAAVIVKILSAVYRVPFQNIVGDVGFYIYQQVYPLYGMAVALSTYGFPVIISKLIAEHEGNDWYIQRLVRLSFIITSAIGAGLFAAIYWGASSIAGLMGDPSLAPLIQITAFSYLLMPLLTVWRGTFQGKGNMVPTAVSQTVEQSVRVGAILLCSFLIIEMGYSLYGAGAAAFAGSLAGSVAGAIVLYVCMRKRHAKLTVGSRVRAPLHKKEARILLVQGAAICISSMTLVLLQLVDSLNLYSGLIQAGADELAAKTAKGVYDRGQPLVQLGTVAAASLALTLVPLVTSAHRKGKKLELRRAVRLALKVSFTLGLAAAVGLINIMDAVNVMLFESSEGSAVLSVFCFSILFSSIILTLSGILQGLDKEFLPVFAAAAAVMGKYIGNVVLVPLYGTAGASFSTMIALGGAAVMLIISIRTCLNIRLIDWMFIGRATVAVACMTAVLQLWRRGAEHFLFSGEGSRAQMTVIAVSSVVIGASVFICALLKAGLFTNEELRQIPLGDKLQQIKDKISKKK